MTCPVPTRKSDKLVACPPVLYSMITHLYTGIVPLDGACVISLLFPLVVEIPFRLGINHPPDRRLETVSPVFITSRKILGFFVEM